MASFNGKVIEGGLNLRSSCSTSSSSPIQIPNNTSIVVETVSGQHAWFATSYGGYDGYVVAEFVAISNDGGTCTVSTSSGPLNIRKTPSSSATVLFTAAKGVTLRLLDTTSVNGWYRVSNSEGTGWASSDYLTIGNAPGGNNSGGGTGGNTSGGTGVNTATWAQVLAGNGVYKKESSSSATCDGVKDLQNYLKAIGYGANNVGNIVVDGNFGSITEAAVILFQRECGLDDDGIVGKNTATKLVAVQNNTWFTRPEYYPLKKELMEYSTYPAMSSNEARERSIVVRAISSEHGYASYTSTGHQNARIGVAKVMLNRTRSNNVNLANPNDHSFRSVYLCDDYTSKKHDGALYLPRGYATTMQQMHSVAATVVAGNWPSGADKVTQDHLFQKGAGAYDEKYESRPGYCRYPETGNQFSFFYIGY